MEAITGVNTGVALTAAEKVLGAPKVPKPEQEGRVERELKQKDNDTYRKQHATFIRLS